MLRYLYRKLVSYEARKRRHAARRLRSALREVARFPKHPDAPRHSLPAPLVVSLTSYPARFATLDLTIKSLLDQTVRPDTLILWIAHDDAALLPEKVLALRSAGLTIDYCEDSRNFKKILPTLARFPGAFVATVDDDLYYPDHWLAGLIAAYDPAEPTVVCYRAHRLSFDEAGELAPYYSWPWSVMDEASARPSTDLLPTGNGGVLYPPGSLASEATDLDLIRRLSPTCDDTWLFFMWRRAGWSIRRVPGAKFELIDWPGSQAQSLYAAHQDGTKDKHLADMSRHFGVPRP